MVAAGRGEAVAVADGRHRRDVDAEIEVGYHPADQGKLLRVLLAEHGDVRPGQPEQLDHDGEDAAAETRPELTLEALTRGARIDRHHRRGGVHLARAGCEDHRNTLVTADGDVLVERAGIAVQILARAELERVDEHADQQGAAGSGELPRAAKERPVTGVQRAHGRHEHHGAGEPAARGGEGRAAAGEDRRHSGGPLSTSSRRSASCGVSSPAAIARSAVSLAIATYAPTAAGGDTFLSASMWLATVPASPRATRPVTPAMPNRSALPSAAEKNGPSTRAGSRTPAPRSSSADSVTSVVRWFAAPARAAW